MPQQTEAKPKTEVKPLSDAGKKVAIELLEHVRKGVWQIVLNASHAWVMAQDDGALPTMEAGEWLRAKLETLSREIKGAQPEKETERRP